VQWGAMPDDNFRPTHGLPPDSRPTNTPPAWWALLDRVDLPDSREETLSGSGNRWRSQPSQAGSGRAGRRRWHIVAINLAVVLAAGLLIVLGLSVAAPGATAATLLVCGMVALLSLVGVGVARRIGRRW
jgi:hypothetical protein